MSFVHARCQLLDRSLVTYVDHRGVGAVPGGADVLDGVLGPLLVDLGHHHFGASGGEGIRRRPADPTPTAGHDGDLVVQIDAVAHRVPSAPIVVVDILCEP